MPAPVLNARQAALADAALIGGKAHQTAWLTRHGYDVPAWIVVTTDGCAALLEAGGVAGRIAATLAALPDDPAAARAARADLRARIEAIRVPDAWHAALEAALYETFPDAAERFFAVRSSGVGEDAAAASFAGQMDSFLFQRGPEAVARAVLRCLASAYSERALHYRRAQGLPPAGVRTAVLIQAMVEGDVSGVLFTAHPVTGSRRHALLSACYGLGEGVVSGRCETDTFTVDLRDGPTADPIAAEVRRKDVQVVFDAARGYGTVEMPVHPALQERPCLTDAQVRRIVDLGAAVAAGRGAPQDIEWTLRGDRLYVLQTRPVTALPPPREADRRVWDNANIQESYCGVTTPLTFSFARLAYATVYEETMRVMGLPERVIDAHRELLRNLLGFIRGRVYYNIDHWYRGLLLLPAFRTNKADMERMMGLQDPVDFVEDRVLSFRERLAHLPRLTLTLGRLLARFRRIDALVTAFEAHFAAVYGRVDRRRLHQHSLTELVELSRMLRRDLLGAWSTPIVNDFFVMMMNGRVHRILERLGLDAPGRLLNGLLAGEQGLESAEPTRRLLALTEQVRRRPAVRRLFDPDDPAGGVPDDRLLAALQVEDEALYRACLDYLETYGDRGMGELKLETIPPRHDPAFLFACIRNYLSRPDLTPETLDAREAALRREAEAEAFALIRARLGRRRLRRFRKDLARLRTAIRHRERMRMDRTRLFGLFRDLYLEAGRRLHGYGRLDDPRDVFYLTVEEIDAFVDGTAVQAELRALCRSRRAEFAAYAAEELPHHFITHGAPYLAPDYRYPYAEPVPAEGDGVLQGTGCYPGVVEAPVRLIFSPEDARALDGQILCTVRTDPGWAPLFPTAGGLLVERGSTLSHSAIVARELGIPAIVGIPGLTRRLRDGERVRMDGATGRIERPG